MPTSKPFNVKAFLEEWAKQEVPEYQSKALTELDFRQHEERLMALMQSEYAVPKDLIMGGMRSGRSAAIAQLEQMAKERGIKIVRPTMDAGIKGRSAVSMFIDEAVPTHPNCRCETIPPTDSRFDLTTAHDDMLDAMAMTFGLSRTDGEADADFRARVKAMTSSHFRSTHESLEQAVYQVSGVENVIINETGMGEVVVHVCIDEHLRAADVMDVRERVMMAVEEARPAGIKVEYHWDDTRDRPSQLSPEEVRRQEEELFIRRLRSKILERYPGEE